MFEGIKVVAAEEMARIEKGLKGHEQFMKTAGQKVADAAIKFITREKLPKKVTLLVGKGNNGGDAYVAGLCLLEKGYKVAAYVVDGKCSALNQKFGALFRKKKGKIAEKLDGLILDGLLGTGFKGNVEGQVASMIEAANQSGLPIIAIDIPSGLNGTTGDVGSVAIKARETIALGLPKMGFFLKDGWNHVGKLHVVDFGLPKQAVAEAEAMAYLPLRVKAPKMVRNRHKYQAGYVVGYGGSKEFSGAVKLSGLSALKAGAGIVRIFTSEPIGETALELICNPWSAKAWKEALGKAKAIFVGPGLGKSEHTTKWLKEHLKEIKQHCVIDADALMAKLTYPKWAVLTPHRGEMLRLLGLKTEVGEMELFSKVIRFCNRRKVVVVLKGAPTFIFEPGSKPIIVPRGDPGMATAGSGDVLTGMIAAFLAQGCTVCESAVLGVTLHAIAGEKAAKELTSPCVIASDLIKYLPAAFRSAKNYIV
ncbi:MAG: bifunctional ADP-dependent NAD(P)H-hydrate dehydratase/NAD(P)H-hydrate epimerase [Chlamydiae bacterium CG10_big_fil_rev_8_21_14_0_10_42_34]|nr:MAG: bifunctional ADP-dependent NAD(P)H-hydrate dehydratase/NAD(P)H-hydrate epimerase [Chlamydiae bacterium CG10_big_fil_rev_8_21_14_0_10_42_34]